MTAMGAVRHVSDIRADDASAEGKALNSRQLGTNEFASQKGMHMGAIRHGADYRQDKEMLPEGHGVLSPQRGWNGGM